MGFAPKPLLCYWLHTYVVKHDFRLWKEEKKISLYSLSIYFHKILITLTLIYHLCKIPLILTGRLPGCEVLYHLIKILKTVFRTAPGELKKEPDTTDWYCLFSSEGERKLFYKSRRHSAVRKPESRLTFKICWCFSQDGSKPRIHWTS